jgi:hypothetical protein
MYTCTMAHLPQLFAWVIHVPRVGDQVRVLYQRGEVGCHLERVYVLGLTHMKRVDRVKMYIIHMRWG